MKEELSEHAVPYFSMQEKTDATLVKLAREDDRLAFHVLMERYQVMAEYIAVRMIPDAENARELVQEAMLQAFLSLDRLRDESRFKSWFYGIVLNICRSWRREFRIDTVSLDTATGNWHSQLQNPEHDLTDPQTYLERQELHLSLDTALNTLSSRNSVVVRLFYYDEMSIQEIAQQLKISPTAVKNRLHKGRRLLRASLLKTVPDMMPITIPKRGKNIMMKVSIAKIVPQDHRTLVILQDETQQRLLSIWLKADWTDPIQRMRMTVPSQSVLTEPLTTDFMVNLLNATDSTIRKIEIEELQDEILYARVFLHSHGESRRLNARLNDALPLALRLDCEMYVADAVMERLGQKLATQPGREVTEKIDTLSTTLTERMFAAVRGQVAVASKEPRNLDFSDGLHGWWFLGAPKEASTYQIDQAMKRNGKASLAMTNLATQPLAMAFLYHEGFLADNYFGKRLRMRADVKTEDVGQVVVGVETNGPKKSLNLRQISAPLIRSTTDWTQHEVVFDVLSDMSVIKFVLRMVNTGRVWLSGVDFAVVGSDVPLTEDAGPRQPFPDEPQNTQFVHDLAHWELWGNYPQDYTCGIDRIDDATCGYIKSSVVAPRGHGILRQTIRCNRYRGKYVRLIGRVKTSEVEDHALFYAQLDGKEIDEGQEQWLQGITDWSQQEVTMYIPEQGVAMLRFGVVLHGKGQVWLDHLRLELI